MDQGLGPRAGLVEPAYTWVQHQAGAARSTSRTSSPYLRSFDSPTPDTRSSSARLVGLTDAMAASVVSWNTTYAGTPAARAVSSLHCRSRSRVSTGTFPDRTLIDSAGSVR